MYGKDQQLTTPQIISHIIQELGERGGERGGREKEREIEEAIGRVIERGEKEMEELERWEREGGLGEEGEWGGGGINEEELNKFDVNGGKKRERFFFFFFFFFFEYKYYRTLIIFIIIIIIIIIILIIRYAMDSTTILREWFWEHLFTSTYPNTKEMIFLTQETRLEETKV